MTTRAELRETLSAFRDMVRERGPRECLEVSCLCDVQICNTAIGGTAEERMQLLFRVQDTRRLAARAALRWWRWGHRNGAYLLYCVPGGKMPPIRYDFVDD